MLNLTFDNSRIDGFVHMTEDFVASGLNLAFGELSLELALKLHRLIGNSSPADTRHILLVRSESCLSLRYKLIGVVDAHHLIRLVDPLCWGSSPSVQDRNLLSHVLARLGASERKLFLLDALSRKNTSWKILLLLNRDRC